MTPDFAKIKDGKKFMWDGDLYDTREQAAGSAQSYQGEGFEAQIEEADGKFLVYTRRTAKEVVGTTQ
jgi:hypothetical protein